LRHRTASQGNGQLAPRRARRTHKGGQRWQERLNSRPRSHDLARLSSSSRGDSMASTADRTAMAVRTSRTAGATLSSSRAQPAEAIDGYAPGGIGVGVLGASDVGYGVLGESGSGFDLSAFGTGRVFQFSITDNLGNVQAGPPSFTPAQPPNFPGGELVRDANS